LPTKRQLRNSFSFDKSQSGFFFVNFFGGNFLLFLSQFSLQYFGRFGRLSPPKPDWGLQGDFTDVLHTFFRSKASDVTRFFKFFPDSYLLLFCVSSKYQLPRELHNCRNCITSGDILCVPPILQQIQISVDQPYVGPAASCCVISGTHSIYHNEVHFTMKH
jgi:hypothetical protein